MEAGPLPQPQGPLSRARRFLAGAWQVPSSLLFLLGRPKLWPLALLPVVAIVLLVGGGLAVGLVLGPSLAELLLADDLGTTLRTISGIGIHLGSGLTGMIFGLALALVLTAPIQELLSRRVERELRGDDQSADGNDGTGIRWELVQIFRGASYFLLRAPLVPLLGLIPIAGPPLGILWAAHCLAFQQTDATLARHRLDFPTRRRWHRRYRMESIGFGLAGLLTLLVPVANLLLVPILVVAGTRLALARLEGTGAEGSPV